MSFKKYYIGSLDDKIQSLLGILFILIGISALLFSSYIAFSPLDGLYMNSDSTETYDTIGEVYMYNIDDSGDSINVYSDGVSGKTTFEIYYINSLGITNEGFGSRGSNTVSSKESKTINLEEGSNEIVVSSDSPFTMIAIQTELTDSHMSKKEQIASRGALFVGTIILLIILVWVGSLQFKQEEI
jgi:hypothetical protein